MKRLIFMAMALAITAPVASAALVTIYIKGVVDSVTDNGALEGKVKAGDIISGYYIYDTSTPDSGFGAEYGFPSDYWHQNPPCGFYLTIGELELSPLVQYRLGISLIMQHFFCKFVFCLN